MGRPFYQHLHFIGPIKVPVTDRASFMINHYGYQVENDLFWAVFGQAPSYACGARSHVALNLLPTSARTPASTR